MKTAREDAYLSAGLRLAVRENCRRLDALAVRAAGALEAASVPFLLLRGPVFAHWLYDDPAERPYDDVDLLVPAPKHDQASELLIGLGLAPLLDRAAPSERAPHAETFVSDEGTVDLHWTLKGVGARPDAAWAGLSKDAEEIRLADGVVPVPAQGARALTIALHAAQHGPQGPVQLRDAERAVGRLPRFTWQKAAVLAKELDALPAFVAGLRTASGGEQLLRVLGVDARMSLDLAVRAEGDVPLIRGLSRLSETRGAAAKRRLISRELVPTPAFMREWSFLARRGPVGLLAAYSMRPFWLAWRLVPALRAYRRARKAVR